MNIRQTVKVLCAAAMCAAILCTAGCGKDEQPEVYGTGGSSATNEFSAQAAIGAVKADGTGLRLEHITGAGFDMGNATLDSIKAWLGEPYSVDSDEYTAMSISTATYPQGVFEFDGAIGEEQKLSYVRVQSGLPAPGGIELGSDLFDTADRIYTGSADAVRGADPAQEKLWLYGDESAASSGYFANLTSEFTSGDTEERCVLEYVVPSAQGGRVRCTLYFNDDNKLCYYVVTAEQ